MDRNDRMCVFCFLNETRLLLEDEFRVFLICPKCATIRSEYLYNWYSGNCELHNIYNLLQSKNVCVIRKMAFYVYKF